MENLNNYDAIKYETNNPIAKLILKNFFDALEILLDTIHAENVYEVGCGNGYVTEFLKRQYPKAHISAMDIDGQKVAIAKTRIEGINFSVGTIYDTMQQSDSFDLVISTEVLEHLDDPLRALKELARISRRYILITTPNEPFWRIANMARLKYISAFGNTPGHINHWSKKSLCAFANEICNVQAVKTPFPFTILLCEKRCNVK
ncbi:MAG: class I SAM-dependent methyltransferase [Zoogloeaceae bacterium]|nr:class I SAM-dependent methyltransferase [Zoogloeaceae bacterium]